MPNEGATAWMAPNCPIPEGRNPLPAAPASTPAALAAKAATTTNPSSSWLALTRLRLHLPAASPDRAATPLA